MREYLRRLAGLGRLARVKALDALGADEPLLVDLAGELGGACERRFYFGAKVRPLLLLP